MSGSDTDLTDVDDVWIGDQSVAGEEFVAALDSVREFQASIDELRDELDDMNVGLDRDDAIRLIYARNSSMTLNQVETAFGVLDAFTEESLPDVAPRILADQSGKDLTVSEAAEVWDDIVTLAEKYGSLNGQTENDT